MSHSPKIECFCFSIQTTSDLADEIIFMHNSHWTSPARQPNRRPQILLLGVLPQRSSQLGGFSDTPSSLAPPVSRPLSHRQLCVGTDPRKVDALRLVLHAKFAAVPRFVAAGDGCLMQCGDDTTGSFDKAFAAAVACRVSLEAGAGAWRLVGVSH